MKKFISLVVVCIFSLGLVGCGKKITTEDLRANEWLIETKEAANMIMKFSDHVISYSIDTSSMGTDTSNELEALGEDFAKAMLDQVLVKVEYTLDGDEIKIQDSENDEKFIYYKITKDGKNLVLDPVKDNNAEKLTLQPYTAPKKTEKTKSSETSQTSSSEDKRSTAEAEYHATLDEYTQKLEDAAQKLTTELNAEAQSNTAGMAGLKTIMTGKTAQLDALMNDAATKLSGISTEYDATAEYQKFYDQIMAIYTNVSKQLESAYSAQLESYSQTAEVSAIEVPEQPQQNTETPAPAAQYVTVQSGDSPAMIAQNAGITLEELAQLNGIDPYTAILSSWSAIKSEMIKS